MPDGAYIVCRRWNCRMTVPVQLIKVKHPDVSRDWGIVQAKKYCPGADLSEIMSWHRTKVLPTTTAE